MAAATSASTGNSEGLVVNSRCWAPHHTEAYVEARVDKFLGGDRVQVKLDDPQHKTGRRQSVAVQQPPWECSSKDLLPRGEKADVVANMDDMQELHVAAILSNVEALYCRPQPELPGCGWSSIYSSVGPVLIAMNPCTNLPLYNDAWVRAYRSAGDSRAFDNGGNAAAKALGPHCYGTIEQAYQALRVARHQSVVICGESGAGKTVTNRKMLEYLLNAQSMRDAENPASPQLLSQSRRLSVRSSNEVPAELSKTRIAQANALLEAFGNAKTVRNDNSSRFGKYSMLHFRGSRYEVKGFQIEPYLLERSRITAEPPGERNYHIFHQLFKSPEASSAYGLGSGPTKFHYTANGVAVKKVDGNEFDDEQDFQELEECMEQAGITGEARKQVFVAIAAVLHLGNVSFDGDADASSIADSSRGSLEKACELLGIDSKAFEISMIRRKVRENWANQGVAKAEAQRDAVAKAVYSRTFDRLIETINEKLVPRRSYGGDDSDNAAVIGLLDIFGFEDMPINGLEQMYINLTNERIQYLFNNIMFDREREVYKQEGIEGVFDPGPSNWPCIDLFIKRAPPVPGIVHVIKDMVKMQKDGEGIVRELNKNHKDHESYGVCDPQAVNRAWEVKRQRWQHHGLPKQGPRSQDCFRIVHYAGPVIYTVKEFVPKSSDALLPHVADVLHASKNIEIKGMFGAQEASRKTVGEKFIDQLEVLAKRLSEGSCLFVRCIKPNLGMIPGIVDRPLVLEQLTCGGVVKAVEMRRTGYPDRREYFEFCEEFAILENRDRRSWDPRERCERLLEDYIGNDVPRYAFGLTRIFMKSGVLSRMRAFVDFRLYIFAIVVQRKWRHKKGVKIIHLVETASRTLEEAAGDARAKGFDSTPVVAEAIARAKKPIDDVRQALQSAKQEHSEHTHKIAETMDAHMQTIGRFKELLNNVTIAVREVAERKRKADEALASSLADARRKALAMLTRISEIENECAGGQQSNDSNAVGPPEQVACAEACARARQHVDGMCRQELKKLQEEGPLNLDLSKEPDVTDPAPRARELLREGKSLLAEAETQLAALKKVRFNFEQAASGLLDEHKAAREKLEELQAVAREDIADGLSGVGEALDVAWKKEALVHELQYAALDAEAYRQAVNELVAAQHAAEVVVKQAAEFRARRRQEEEKLRREALEAEAKALTEALRSLPCSDDLRQAGATFMHVLKTASEELASREAVPEDPTAKLRDKFTELEASLQTLGFEEPDSAQSLRKGATKHFSDTEDNRWSVSCTHTLGEEVRPEEASKAQMLDTSLVKSIRHAVEGLNSGIFHCPEGFCIVYSESRRCNFLLWRCDLEQRVLDLFGIQK